MTKLKLLYLVYMTNSWLPRSNRNKYHFIIILVFCTLFFLIYFAHNKSVFPKHIAKQHEATETIDNDIKYILEWTSNAESPFEFLQKGNEAFQRNKCEYKNCYITNNSEYFISAEEFNAIIFNGVSVKELDPRSLPKKRSHKQKYIFGAMESAERYPICDKRFDGYFNWTWTYKLDSDMTWGYMAIYDVKGNHVGPNVNMQWLNKMAPINDILKSKLSRKTKAAAWFVSHCITERQREHFVTKTRKHLNKFGLSVDVFGKCGQNVCPKSMGYRCFKMLEDKYFFYFAFENSFAEDYVTEKVVNALNYNMVPVVFGGANYSRFLPNGCYLNARELGPRRLANRMFQIINNITTYHDFFRWKNHYVYESRGRNDVCKLCAALNDKAWMEKITVWENFTNWWNGENACSHYRR